MAPLGRVTYCKYVVGPRPSARDRSAGDSSPVTPRAVGSGDARGRPHPVETVAQAAAHPARCRTSASPLCAAILPKVDTTRAPQVRRVGDPPHAALPPGAAPRHRRCPDVGADHQGPRGSCIRGAPGGPARGYLVAFGSPGFQLASLHSAVGSGAGGAGGGLEPRLGFCGTADADDCPPLLLRPPGTFVLRGFAVRLGAALVLGVAVVSLLGERLTDGVGSTVVGVVDGVVDGDDEDGVGAALPAPSPPAPEHAAAPRAGVTRQTAAKAAKPKRLIGTLISGC